MDAVNKILEEKGFWKTEAWQCRQWPPLATELKNRVQKHEGGWMILSSGLNKIFINESKEELK